MNTRCVQPELLDSLPPFHPDAIRSRRDLRLINGIMGNFRWLRRQLGQRLRPQDRILELGAGDGALSRSLLTHGIARPEQLLALDLHPPPLDWPADAHWLQQDLFSAPFPDAEIVIANLFLHHFESPQLARIGSLLSPQTRLLLLSEPERRRRFLWTSPLLHLLFRLNHVTRFDMRVSIQAGFRGSELIEALQLPSWKTQQMPSLFGAHRVIASR
jgi:2-polyprenyl-3-methyl-5-hydroxy-6-metoxy-1,4-benzoquinol methylase